MFKRKLIYCVKNLYFLLILVKNIFQHKSCVKIFEHPRLMKFPIFIFLEI